MFYCARVKKWSGPGMEGNVSARVELIIRNGTPIGFEAEVSLFHAGEAQPFKQFRLYLPTKADCHAFALHAARQLGISDYRTDDQTGL
jgi:hypothetical protein